MMGSESDSESSSVHNTDVTSTQPNSQDLETLSPKRSLVRHPFSTRQNEASHTSTETAPGPLESHPWGTPPPPSKARDTSFVSILAEPSRRVGRPASLTPSPASPAPPPLLFRDAPAVVHSRPREQQPSWGKRGGGGGPSTRIGTDVHQTLASATETLPRQLWGDQRLPLERGMPRACQPGGNPNTWDGYAKALGNEEWPAQGVKGPTMGGDGNEPPVGNLECPVSVDDRVTPQTMHTLLRKCFHAASPSKRRPQHSFPVAALISKRSRMKRRNSDANNMLDEKAKALDLFMPTEQQTSGAATILASTHDAKHAADAKEYGEATAVSNRQYENVKLAKEISLMQNVDHMGTPQSDQYHSGEIEGHTSDTLSRLPFLSAHFKMQPEQDQDQECPMKAVSKLFKTSENNLPNSIIPPARPNIPFDFGITKSMIDKNDSALVSQLVKHYSRNILKGKTSLKRRNAPLTQANVAKLPQGLAVLRSILKSTESIKEGDVTMVRHPHIFEKGHAASSRPAPEAANAQSKRPRSGRLESVDELPFSFLQAVLSVSREYERTGHDGSGSSAALTSVTQGASAVAQNRFNIIRRLTSLDSTHIPEHLWVMANQLLNTHVNESVPVKPSSGAMARSTKAPLQSAFRAHLDHRKIVNGANGGASSNVPIEATASRFEAGQQRKIDSAPLNRSEVLADSEEDMSFLDYFPLRHDESVAVLNSGGFSAKVSRNVVFFPAPRPIGRAQVYLLAEVLDKMLMLRPEWLSNLTDPDTAFRILPPSSAQGTGPETYASINAAAGELSEERTEPSLSAELARKSEEVYKKYTNASAEVTRILDMGLTELVRQVSCECAERGALLDALRQTLVDITESHVRVLEHAKRRALDEAQARLDLQRTLDMVREELQETKQQVADKEAQCIKLQEGNVILANKAKRLDDLVSRVEIRRQSSKGVSDEEARHFLLSELERDITKTSAKTFQLLYNESKRLASLWEEGNEVSNNIEYTETPSLEETRKRATEEKKAIESIYEQSYKLLNTLHEVTDSVDAVCEPFYGKVLLSRMSPQGSPATSRWMSIARAIGKYERLKAHRYRVFSVFSEWCVRYHKQKMSTTMGSSVEDYNSSSQLILSPENGEIYPFVDVLHQLADVLNPHVASTGSNSVHAGPVETVTPNNVMSVSIMPCSNETVEGNARGSSETLHHLRAEDLKNLRFSRFDNGAPHPVWDDRTAKHKTTSGKGKKDLSEVAAAVSTHLSQLKSIQMITDKDLLEMNVTDCTKEEINRLFEHGFDFKSYLNLPREQFMAELQQENSAMEGVPAERELGYENVTPRKGSKAFHTPEEALEGPNHFTIQDVSEMLQDVQACLRELSARFHAIGLSEVVQRGAQPPLQPPARPDDRCPLCGRRDVVSLERNRRQEMMRSVAHAVQQRLDAMTVRCQRAEADREVARGETRQIRKELEKALERLERAREHLALSERRASGGSKRASGERKRLEKTMTPSDRTSQLHGGRSRQRALQQNGSLYTNPLGHNERGSGIRNNRKRSTTRESGTDGEKLVDSDPSLPSVPSSESVILGSKRRSTLPPSEADTASPHESEMLDDQADM